MARALAAGCDDYLVKPPPREILWQLLAGRKVESPARACSGAVDAIAPVYVDPDLSESLPAFLESRRQGLDDLPRAVDNGDRTAFRRLAHKLAGGFPLYGFAWA